MSSKLEIWQANRKRLSAIRTWSEELASVVSDSLLPSAVPAFFSSVQQDGLYVAVDRLDEILQEELQERLVDRLALFQQYNPLAPEGKLPVHSGKIVPTTLPKHLRAESIWSLQESFITNLPWSKKAEDSFEQFLPPTVSSKHIQDGRKRGLWHSVRDCPITHREALCANLIKKLGIPLPPEPANTSKFVATGKTLPPPRVMNIDLAGNCWTWNCGWFRVGADGLPLDSKAPLGHLKFRKSIKLAPPSKLAESTFRYTRPWGEWRRGTGRVSHTLFGNGDCLHTDGVHAVVAFDDGIRREVVFSNLSPVGEKMRHKPAAGDKPARAPRSTPQSKLDRALARLDSLSPEELNNLFL